MAKLLCFLFAIILVVTYVSAQQGKCSPWLGPCSQYDDCCRDLLCLGYAHKCIPYYGIKVPGADKRPIGDGPFPPAP